MARPFFLLYSDREIRLNIKGKRSGHMRLYAGIHIACSQYDDSNSDAWPAI